VYIFFFSNLCFAGLGNKLHLDCCSKRRFLILQTVDLSSLFTVVIIAPLLSCCFPLFLAYVADLCRY